MESLMELAVQRGATDLHINPGEAPTLRLDTKLRPLEGMARLTSEDAWSLVRAITTDAQQATLQAQGSVDFAYHIEGKSRFRVNAFRVRNAYALSLRLIPEKILKLDSIGLPSNIEFLLQQPRGLILVTGPTGAGKSTTLAAMIDWFNCHREGHIVTLEDPIEYAFHHGRCLISQREIGNDTPNFKRALKDVLRQNPDIILIGEMRDLETIEAAVTAAETGHLVLATLHTTGAARTVDRIIDVFPAESKNYIRTQLASNLVAVLSQVLCPKVPSGLVAAFEIMVNTTGIASLIRENKTFRIASEIQTGVQYGMITLDNHLFSLYSQKKITKDIALRVANEPAELQTRLAK